MPHVTDLYSLPSLYDTLHAAGTAEELDTVERIASRFVRPNPTTRGKPRLTLLEPACGSGRLIRLAASRGTRCIGFDLNRDMLAYARRSIRRRGLTDLARVFHADMTDFTRHLEGERADLAFNLINTIRHLPDDDAMLAHFAEIARALRPGGVYAVGISLTDYEHEAEVEDVWNASRGQRRITQIINYLPPQSRAARRDRVERVLSHLVVTTPNTQDHIDSTYTLRTYSRAQWDQLVERSPLHTVGVVDDWGDPTEPAEPGYAIHLLSPG